MASLEDIPTLKLPEGLSPEQKDKIVNMPKEECIAFCTSEGDVGCAEELQMKINLSDDRPVEKNYVGVLKPLYPELKACVEDLLNRGFITKSSLGHQMSLLTYSLVRLNHQPILEGAFVRRKTS